MPLRGRNTRLNKMETQEIRTGLTKLYADTLKQMCARLGHQNPRPMNRLQTISFIVSKAEHGEKRDYIVECVNFCERK